MNFFTICKASELHYKEFINKVLSDSEIIKAKSFDLSYEKIEKNKASYYYLPKVKSVSSYKKIDGSDNFYADNTLKITSTLYTTSLNNKFKEADSRVRSAELALDLERERISKLVLDNLIALHYYNSLDKETKKLKTKALELHHKIEARFNSGVATRSDVEQGRLLIQKLDADISNIEKEISLIIKNIEIATGADFPQQGVTLEAGTLSNIENKKISQDQIKNNIEYRILNEKANIEVNNAKQKDTFLTIGLSADKVYHNRKKYDDDSYFGIDVTLNIFDFDNKTSYQSSMEKYNAAKATMEFKYKELLSRFNSLELMVNANKNELKNLRLQKDTLHNIIHNQANEYNIAQSSYYEMLNTQYDFFTINKKITELMVTNTVSRLNMFQLAGELLEL